MGTRRELAGGLAWLHVLCWEHPTLTPSLTHSLTPSLPQYLARWIMTMRSTCYGPKELRCSNSDHSAADWLFSPKHSGSVRAVGEDAIVKQRGSESQGKKNLIHFMPITMSLLSVMSYLCLHTSLVVSSDWFYPSFVSCMYASHKYRSRKNLFHSNNAARSTSSISRNASGVEVTLAIRYSTLPSTRECTAKCSPPAASRCCSPWAAVDVYPAEAPPSG